MENTSASSTASVRRTSAGGGAATSCCAWRRPGRCWCAAQRPTRPSTTIASNAAIENQARLAWPCGTMNAAASSGPSAVPALPPTWKIDCARPWRPPDASRATRDDSGWKIDEPMPTQAAATSTWPKLSARDSSSRPQKVKPMPTDRENGRGLRSVYRPTSGCRIDAVTW
ncbi:hypothetical protein GALL_361300 [mine drainage metagenome]|uniref:Uncharacterized protein n=1 Tax=mine drainage metagenome TaxID=410659 RepID=A0A1J5QEY1_9ZZZZ